MNNTLTIKDINESETASEIIAVIFSQKIGPAVYSLPHHHDSQFDKI